MTAKKTLSQENDLQVKTREAGEATDVMLTVYNDDLALVKETRNFILEKGVNRVTLTGVPSSIDATSVHFKPLAGDVFLHEQNYDYDLVSRKKLLAKYIGKEITIRDEAEEKQVRLLSVGDGLVVDYAGTVLLNPPGNVELPSLPGGLLLKPTLEWMLEAAKAVETSGEISYTTSGFSWSADYILLLDDRDKFADLEGWVTMENTSGASFVNAKLKLLAGKIHRAPRPKTREMFEAHVYCLKPGPVFEEERFSEYHLYTLQRPATILNAQTKQLSLLEGRNVAIYKTYILGYHDKVKAHIAFKNTEENHLGIPLPAGRLRVFKRDKEGSPQLAGEDAIGHTAVGEWIQMELGDCFDVVGKMKCTSHTDLKNGFQSSYEVVIRNHKDEDIEVIVPHHLPNGINWRMLEHSLPYRTISASEVRFILPVTSNGESKLTFSYECWMEVKKEAGDKKTTKKASETKKLTGKEKKKAK